MFFFLNRTFFGFSRKKVICISSQNIFDLKSLYRFCWFLLLFVGFCSFLWVFVPFFSVEQVVFKSLLFGYQFLYSCSVPSFKFQIQKWNRAVIFYSTWVIFCQLWLSILRELFSFLGVVFSSVYVNFKPNKGYNGQQIFLQ